MPPPPPNPNMFGVFVFISSVKVGESGKSESVNECVNENGMK